MRLHQILGCKFCIVNEIDFLPEINRDYNLKGKIVRYIGKGKNTNQFMFRDTISGNFIFVNEACPKTRVEIIYA